VKLKTTAGTSKDLADHAIGYAANGESSYTRRAARPDSNIRGTRASLSNGRHSVSQLIEESKKLLARMQCELRIETNKERLAKLRSNIVIKAAFIEKLERE
jgi:hypothetical protein